MRKIQTLKVESAGIRADATKSATRVGTLVGFAGDGSPLVEFEDNPAGEPLQARTALRLTGVSAGRELVLVFERGDLRKPIVIGALHARGVADDLEIVADGERLLVNAQQEIVLRCGRASITLTKAGKVLIKGAYVSTHSTGVNRVKGGSVQIN
jgi:uncharacterized protein (DUF2345 family)